MRPAFFIGGVNPMVWVVGCDPTSMSSILMHHPNGNVEKWLTHYPFKVAFAGSNPVVVTNLGAQLSRLKRRPDKSEIGSSILSAPTIIWRGSESANAAVCKTVLI